MIINKLVFPVKLDGSFVEGSIPSAHLTANSINRDMFYVISPKPQDTIVCANFQNSLQSGEPDTVVMLPSEIEVNELVSKDASYYELIKEWNVWQGFLPSLALEKVAFDRASPLGISFSFKQLIKPKLPNLIGYEYQGIIDSENFIPSLNGYYYIGLPYYEVAGISFTKNDLLIKTSSEIIRKQAITQKSNTGTLTYSVDPSVMDGVFEEVETSLTESIVSDVSEIKQDLKLIKLTFRNYYTRDETYNRLEIDSSLSLLELKDQEQDQRLDNIETDIGNITESIKIDNDTLVRENEVIKVSDKLTNQINVNKNDIANNATEIQSVKDTTYTQTQTDNKFATIQAMDLQLKEKLNVKPDGTNPLVIGNKLNSTYIDSLYITDVFVVKNKSELTTLTAQRGDIAIVENENKTYVLKSGSPTVMSNWVELLFPVSVVSVNGKTGAVILGISDIPELESTLNSKLAVNVFEDFKGEVEVDYATKTFVYNAVNALEVDNFAKLNEANAFTQPQSIPSGTEPQHAINVANLDNFKNNEFRGVNLLKPDLTGLEPDADGWYTIYNEDNIQIKVKEEYGDYIYEINGVAENIETTYDIPLGQLNPGVFTAQIVYLDGEVEGKGGAFVFGTPSSVGNHLYFKDFKDNPAKTWENIVPRKPVFYLVKGESFDKLKFKIKIEKGDKATPYTKPFEIPPYTTLDEVMELLKELGLI